MTVSSSTRFQDLGSLAAFNKQFQEPFLRYGDLLAEEPRCVYKPEVRMQAQIVHK